MAVRVRIKPLHTDPIDTKQYLRDLKRNVGVALRKNGTAMAKDYRKVTGKFHAPRPKVVREVNASAVKPFIASKGKGWYARATVDDGRVFWLDLGTRVRWMRMSVGFKGLTKPKSRLKTYRRKGGPVGFVFTPNPLPGIEPREFSIAVEENVEKTFYTDIENAFNTAAATLTAKSRRRK